MLKYNYIMYDLQCMAAATVVKRSDGSLYGACYIWEIVSHPKTNLVIIFMFSHAPHTHRSSVFAVGYMNVTLVRDEICHLL